MKPFAMSTLISLLLIFTNLTNSGCHKATEVNMIDTTVISPITPSPSPFPTLNNKSYLALGDSYTIGQSVDSTERFPTQTIALLKAQSINITSVRYIATTGWTTVNLQNAITMQNPKGPFDVVSLLIGVNDQYQGIDINGYKIRFTQLLQTAISLAGNNPTHVFVLSIPDYSVTPYAANSNKAKIASEIDAFNAANKAITAAFTGVSYIDITPSTRLAAIDPTLIANDGLHPSGKEYNVWAGLLAPVVASMLK